MLRRALLAVLVAVCLVIPLAAQTVGGGYLDLYIVNVKPEKSAEFEALAKKLADANRKYNGDRWLAMDVMYGQNNTTVFVSHRDAYGDIDKAYDSFMGALNKAYGKEASQKMLNEWNSYLVSSRSELRRRRWDLSRKAPAGEDAYVKLIANARVLRTTTVHIRPGRSADFEVILKEVEAAGEKNENTQPLLVSQGMEGTTGTTYYITALRPGMDGFDKNPTMHEILGDEGYKRYLKDVSETIESSESAILRYSAELSAPSPQIIAAAPAFWQPKTEVAAASPKPKKAKQPMEPAAQKEKQ